MKSCRFPQFSTLSLLAFVTFGFAIVSHIQAAQIVYFPLDTDPGWSTQGQWAFGVPTGGGSYCYDPTSGHSGSNVYGYNLAGDYSNNMPVYRLTTTPIDCSGYSNVTLSFWRWLGVEHSYYDHAMVEVSNDGSNWIIVWNYLDYICQSSWVQYIYDISAVADNQPTVYVRWVMGPTDSNYTSCGWNIDDISLSGTHDDLSVTPAGLSSDGFEGGPFTPSTKNYTLNNTGASDFNWTAAEVNDMPWLDVTPTSGTLQPGQSTTVSVSINANANGLASGNYDPIVKFTNSTSGFEQIRPVALTVKDIPPDGWASMNGGTTGGAGGTTVTVNTAADFKTYVESSEPYIVQVSGNIELSPVGGTVSIRSNKTIKGIGIRPTITGSLLFVADSNNIIIKGLHITNPGGGGDGDGITAMWRIKNLFITHCTIYNCPDGCLDITRGCDFVTVSWCKFYYTDPNAGHRFVNLVGGDDGHWADDRGHLRITFHHNWWSTLCYERMPRVRYGQVHVYNNYYSCHNDMYCIASAIEAQLLIENNYFDNIIWPYIHFTQDPNNHEQIRATGNIIYNCQRWDYCQEYGCTFEDPNVFTPPYPYAMDDPYNVPPIVMAGAGAPVCYGDFDHSESMALNDLAQFADYWLETQGIVEMDYDEDGIVNFNEFALLAQNWGRTDFIFPLAPTGLSTTDGNSTVSLDWSDNSEGDLAGYNVYRSTSFGGSYDKLNTSLLSDSNYTDNTVTNSTIYYYVVTAVDTSPLESTYSSQVSAIPLDANSIIIQENRTGFCDVNGVIDKTFTNYTGTGYAKTNMSVGSGINWRVNVPSSGTYTLKWRHSHGAGTRNAKLLINSVEAASISFPATGGGSIWSHLSVNVSLTAGINNIRLKSAPGNYSGLPLIDYMMVTGDNPQPESCP
jgi:pectate lyase